MAIFLSPPSFIPLHFRLPFLLLVLLLPVTSSVGRGDRVSSQQRRQCEEMSIPLCRGAGYNLTYTPNQFHHDSQDEAGLEVHQFWPLVEIQCSPHLRFFLCSLYAPICLPSYPHPLPPCRSICLSARVGCEPLMRQYGFPWPHRMDCDLFPDYADPNRLCMQLNTTYASHEGTSAPISGSSITPSSGDHPTCECKCRSPYVEIRNETSTFFNRVQSAGGEMNCATPCRGLYLSEGQAEEERFIEFWIGLWSILCLLSTTTTLFTFLIEPFRFQFPERSIVFLSLCYTFIAVAYVIRLVLGHDVIACVDNDVTGGDRLLVVRHLGRRSVGGASCHVVFFFLYFFGMASNVWWVILSFSWFLSAGLKWGQEAVSSCSLHFHLTAWILPSAQTIAVLSTSAVDADVTSGLCYVGNSSATSLRLFVIAPLCIYLVCATAFLIAGFVSLMRVRHVIREQCSGTGTSRLERFVVRIGVFSLLYTLPATAQIACFLYEDIARRRYEADVICPHCPDPGRPSADPGRPSADPGVNRQKPEFAVFMVKHFVGLVVGIASGFWVWTGKTVESWSRFYDRLSKDQEDGVERQRQQEATGEGRGGGGGGGGGGGTKALHTAGVSQTRDVMTESGGQGGQLQQREMTITKI